LSLILDALKKLEQEKEARGEKSVLVLGQVPWEGVEPRRRRRSSALVGASLVGVVALAAWALLATRTPRSARESERAAGASAAAPRVSATPPLAPTEEPPPVATELAPAATPAAPAPRAAAPARPSAPSQDARPLGASRPAPPDTSPPDRAPRATAARAAGDTPAPASDGPELRLHAISDHDGVPVALINERLVREGDVFGDVKVLRIGSTEVEVEVRGRRRVLRF
jgi:hypothetical protein